MRYFPPHGLGYDRSFLKRSLDAPARPILANGLCVSDLISWLLPLLMVALAALYSSVGHGGASGYLAAMALCGIAPAEMKPAALILNVLVSSIATFQFAHAGHFRGQLFWPFAVASIPAAYLGGYLTLPGHFYKPLVGAVLWYAAARFFITPSAKNLGNPLPPHRPLALAVGAGIGLLSGLTGTGGGIFLSPLLLFCGWASMLHASAVAAPFVLVNSLSGLLGLFTGTPKLAAALPVWAVAAVVGGTAGAYFGSRRLATPTLRRLLAAVLVIAGAKLIFGV